MCVCFVGSVQVPAGDLGPRLHQGAGGEGEGLPTNKEGECSYSFTRKLQGATIFLAWFEYIMIQAFILGNHPVDHVVTRYDQGKADGVGLMLTIFAYINESIIILPLYRARLPTCPGWRRRVSWTRPPPPPPYSDSWHWAI